MGFGLVALKVFRVYFTGRASGPANELGAHRVSNKRINSLKTKGMNQYGGERGIRTPGTAFDRTTV